ncbi:potassium-transporting ATPase potassium-binding subunit [Elstera cyanobacteriorum]|uniref:Potassium-transporting ATPase potassium-binding subunit n=1 Tax=Elstera cyanobacteriorum TaxID=2022747 RepID=A0A255XR78_9PROT|nr:potassium-transporting ATPase subunit KdpA [Elstera cyanobacteriorum]OYQ19478.1 potassium-transporting ATPase subunit KdpA [Elstera cyanobacteriorum]GFZ91722.1 potassium-transporting ATPase potassium-binding subunit [Elstera cyanobacteriorum]
MTITGWALIALFCLLILMLTRPTGGYLTRVFAGERVVLTPVMGRLERGFYAAAGVSPKAGQGWVAYTVSMLVMNGAGAVLLYTILRLQDVLPLNPQGFGAVSPDLAFNTAVSFVTNTNWQSYGGETTLSHFSQMAGLTVQNFLSAATGICLAVAVIRGFAAKSARDLGNFWVDLTRCTLYVLLPISFIAALFFVWQGVPQTLAAGAEAVTLEGTRQTLSLGPVASQLAIKMLGTNGGGFFNANSTHPFENPTALSNLVQMLLIFVLGAGLTNSFGRMVGNEKQGWAIFAAMGVLFLIGTAVVYGVEASGNPILAQMGVTGGNFEGKEVRFGLAATALFTVITTAASCGAVNAMIDSFLPLGGMIPLINMQLGEIIVGGVGSGLYGMLVFAVLAVFIAGLMVGRTPEYLGKKIEKAEVAMAMLSMLVLPLSILGFTALIGFLPAGLASLQDAGPHGFSEALYAYTSATANNGSAFAGFNANTPLHNTLLGVAMLLGRFAMLVPVMAVAGSLARKTPQPASPGSFPTDTPLFVGLLVGVILIVGGLTYFPSLALGPIAEHLALAAGQLF